MTYNSSPVDTFKYPRRPDPDDANVLYMAAALVRIGLARRRTEPCTLPRPAQPQSAGGYYWVPHFWSLYGKGVQLQ